ncbi:unnamed protein product [Triticum turgidum subsp. durum]|uniref:DNA-directed RNA polymerase subunit n=1 Tax=Triticum turgidum subsp. durum TaxID=4567 RepID=A0A9R1QVD7_TRITD|nr:unnamed protein product [Triticum turgidum subsp. durum]
MSYLQGNYMPWSTCQLKAHQGSRVPKTHGAANKQGECGTCHGSYTECPGHFGYLKLALPVFNVGFFNNILDVVKCICKGCSRVLLVEKDRREFLKKMRQPRAEPLVKFALMKKVRDKCKLSRCPCKSLDGSTEELRSALSHKKEKLAITSIHTLDPATVLSLFRRMIDEVDATLFSPYKSIYYFQPITDCELLNLGDRPEKLIITEIAVPPVPIRPSVFVGGGGGRMSDAPCLIDSQHRGLIQRLKGKTGRFRGNLSGKRTEYTGRTVISPDPNLRITEARIMPWRTLRFNESVCNPYNADFDGDEMNLHVPQTEEARTEALMLMGVQNNLCTPKNGEILVASTQDFLTSSFLITRKDSFYDRSSFTLLCSYLGDAMENIDLPTPALIKPIELWTGKQLFSVLVRPNAFTKVYLNLGVREKICTKKCPLTVEDKTSEAVHDAMCPNDGFVYFRNSELLSGQVGKKTLDWKANQNLIDVLSPVYKKFVLIQGIYLFSCSARFIGNHGFSIGVDDVQPGESLNEKKGKTIGEGYQECHELIAQYSKGALKPQPGCSRAQTLEARISGVLNKLRDTAGDHCMSTLHWRNSPLIMSQCGSKGSPINISQMVVCVGQQSVGGRRAPNGFIDRTLPHFPINSKTPAAKGFVANSFYTGLTATEFFFHTMGGREGLVDTAVKTAETGYMSRRLMKGLEDLSVFYDQTVRNASGGIVQFVYGDDGMDPVKMEGKGGNPLNLDQLFMKVMATCPQRGHETLSPEGISQMLNDKLSEQDPSAGGCSDRFKELLTKFVGNRIKMLRNTRRALHLDEDHVGRKDSSIEECVAANISGISAKQLQVFLDTCLSRYHSKIIEAGASIGAIGAQSIGEPGTQMTLKTFHFAGVASMSILSVLYVTLGVPRIKEIINAAKKISTPIITAELLSGQDESFGVKVKRCIEKVVLGEVAAAIKIVLKSSQPNLVVKLDMQRIEAQGYEGISADSVQLSIINYPKLKLKSQHVRVIDEAKLRIYPDGTDRSKLQFELHNLKSMLPKVIVKGIQTVERAVVNPVKGRDKTIERYNLLVEGTNLLAVLGAPGVDAMKTKSNHIMEVNQTLGIEAARRSIIDEIQYTFESNNMIIDLRHMMLLADLMTYKGEVLGITRYGIAKMKSSVLMLASFEKTSEHLFNASYAGREDQIDGVSECIIMGIPMQLGTGILKVRQRLESLPEFKYQPAPIMSS